MRHQVDVLIPPVSQCLRAAINIDGLISATSTMAFSWGDADRRRQR
jgi:hypothetical protein